MRAHVPTTSLHLARRNESESHSAVSDSFQLHGLYSPWDSPGQNTGVGSLSLHPGDLPNPGIEPRSPTLQADSLPAEPPGKLKDHKLLGNQSSLGKPEAKEVTNSQRKKLTNSGTVLESLRKSSWVLTNQASSIWEASECSGSIFSLRSEGSERVNS